MSASSFTPLFWGTAQQFLDRPLDPLNYYNVLPSDRPMNSLEYRGAPLENLCDELLALQPADLGEQKVESALTALLADQGISVDASKLELVATHVSQAYAAYLRGGESDRSLRMKLAQLNFFLRDRIDRDIDTGAQCASEEHLDIVAPWDWLDLPEGRIVLASGGESLRQRLHGRAETRVDCGLPSQLDMLSTQRISVGSIFTNGAHILRHSVLEAVGHEKPIVLIFMRGQEDWAIDSSGHVFPIAGVHSPTVVPFNRIDRARKLGSRVFVADWSRPRAVGILDLSDFSWRVVEFPNVLLLNDICELHGTYYAICKLQGKLFAYDSDFSPLGERLGFGRGRGRLFDPISLRINADRISILNWVTSTIVTTHLSPSQSGAASPRSSA